MRSSGRGGEEEEGGFSSSSSFGGIPPASLQSLAFAEEKEEGRENGAQIDRSHEKKRDLEQQEEKGEKGPKKVQESLYRFLPFFKAKSGPCFVCLKLSGGGGELSPFSFSNLRGKSRLLNPPP